MRLCTWIAGPIHPELCRYLFGAATQHEPAEAQKASFGLGVALVCVASGQLFVVLSPKAHLLAARLTQAQAGMDRKNCDGAHRRCHQDGHERPCVAAPQMRSVSS